MVRGLCNRTRHPVSSSQCGDVRWHAHDFMARYSLFAIDRLGKDGGPGGIVCSKYDVVVRTMLWCTTHGSTIVHELIDDEVKRGIPSNRIVIGGFSQGAALSLYSGLQYKSPLAGIISMSGYLPHYQTFATAKLSAANKQTPVLVCHGQADPVVHFVAGKTTHEILSRAGVPAQFKQYPGLGHGANAQELNDVREFVTKAIPPL